MIGQRGDQDHDHPRTAIVKEPLASDLVGAFRRALVRKSMSASPGVDRWQPHRAHVAGECPPALFRTAVVDVRRAGRGRGHESRVFEPAGPDKLGSCSRTSAGRGAHMRSAVTPPTGVALALKLHALALVQLLESCTLDAGRVEEQLLAALVPDESEAPISNKARDRAGYRHVCAVPSLSPIGGRPSLPAGRCWRTSVPHDA